MQIQEPLSFYLEEKDKSLKFFLIDCGHGLMVLIILPDDTVILFDCNITDDNKDNILSLLNNNITKKDKDKKIIDIFINSHRDLDHIKGLDKLIENNFYIKEYWDSGQYGENTDSYEYKKYMELKRDKGKILSSSNKPYKIFGDAKIYCLSSKEEYGESKGGFDKIQHTNSLVILVEYYNKKLLLTGDSDYKCWNEKIIKKFGNNLISNIDILIASHHGSKTFFVSKIENDKNIYEENIIKLINPVITLISCGNYEQHNLPDEKSLKIYKKYSKNEQVYTTNDLSTICGFIKDDGYFSVIPYRFKNNISHKEYPFNILCKEQSNKKIANNSTYNKNIRLKFCIRKNCDAFINKIDNIDVIWEVSNAGKWEDYYHQEIYQKDTKKERTDIFEFERDLCYYGKHLLRCYIENKKRKYKGTCIFVINKDK